MSLFKCLQYFNVAFIKNIPFRKQHKNYIREMCFGIMNLQAVKPKRSLKYRPQYYLNFGHSTNFDTEAILFAYNIYI